MLYTSVVKISDDFYNQLESNEWIENELFEANSKLHRCTMNHLQEHHQLLGHLTCLYEALQGITIIQIRGKDDKVIRTR